MKVKCLGQEHNTVSLARARTQTARSRDKHTNHAVTTLNRLMQIYANYYNVTTSYIDNLRVLTNLKDVIKANNPLENETDIHM